MNNALLEENDFLEISLLSRKDLEDYDLNRTYYMVLKFLKNYKRLKCKSFNEPQIKVTTRYKYIFVDESSHSNNEYTKLDQYIDNKTEYLTLSQKIALVTELMTDEERVYFTLCLYKGKKEYTASQEIGCSYKGLLPIKKSCIVKFACAFDIEVYSGDTLVDPEDEKRFLESDDYKV